MLKSVHYFTVEYSLPGDYDYKRKASLNLNKVFQNEEDLIESIKLLLNNVDDIKKRCSLENYTSGILLLNNSLIGEFTLYDKKSEEDYSYNSLSLSINVNLGLYDSENDMLFKSELVYLNN